MNNVFNMLKFDFGEFISSPEGICMIVGCVFLILGIIILICTKKKKPAAPATPAAPQAPAAPEAQYPSMLSGC